MMASKKAAKKAEKNLANKDLDRKAGKDARRTFEHLGRIRVLSTLPHSGTETLGVLTAIAETAFQAEQYKESADLLRAAEHLSFAVLHVGTTEDIAPWLETVIEEEVNDLLERSVHHESHHNVAKELRRVAKKMRSEAKTALESRAFRAALEFARGAEALGHVRGLDGDLLTSGKAQKKLKD